MKVNAQTSNQTKKSQTPGKMSNDDIAAKIQAKFGKVAEVKEAIPPVVDKVEVGKKGVVSSDEEDFGDIGKNIPTAKVTQEKLKSILQNGGFQFNDRERQALGQILK